MLLAPAIFLGFFVTIIVPLATFVLSVLMPIVSVAQAMPIVQPFIIQVIKELVAFFTQPLA